MPITNYEDIVSNYESPTIVLAGPGTGKTYLLADRIKRLLNNGIDKNTITVITFSTDADQHMKNKLTDPNGYFRIEYANLPHISTMHALGLKIVAEKPREANLRKTDLLVQDDEQIKKLLYRDATFILGFAEEDGKEAFKCKQFGDCREVPETNKCKICGKYRHIMSKCNCIDFDDQILFACKILENNPDILAKYQAQTKHLLVDEYQDINAAQFRLIELLSRESRNGLFVVGDDAQSIYGFRGSSPRFILRFAEDFPGVETATLKINHRCHNKVMEDSFKILDKYYREWSGKPQLEYKQTDGDDPKVFQLSSEIAEAKFVAWISRSSLNDKNSVLVLVPKKEFFPQITKALSNYGVPYDCTESFLPKRIETIKRLLDWIKDPNSNFITRLVIEDLINSGIAKVPGARKDGRCTPDTINKRVAEETEIARLWESINVRNKLISVIRSLDNSNATLAKIRDSLSTILRLYSDLGADNRGEFLKQLSIITGIWTNPSQLEEDISSVIDLLQLQHPTSTGLAKLRTMRKAKGLEADVVILVGLESDIVPDPRSTDKTEEARLFYVSMTRAIKSLYLFHAYRRPRNISYGVALTDKRRSEFLDALGRESEFRRA